MSTTSSIAALTVGEGATATAVETARHQHANLAYRRRGGRCHEPASDLRKFPQERHPLRRYSRDGKFKSNCPECREQNTNFVELDADGLGFRCYCEGCGFGGFERLPPLRAKGDGNVAPPRNEDDERRKANEAFQAARERFDAFKAFQEAKREFPDDDTEPAPAPASEPEPESESAPEPAAEPELEPESEPEPATITIADATALRRALTAAGYCPIPLYGKTPPAFGKNNPYKGLAGWQNLTKVTDEMIAMWARTWPDAVNTGVLTRNVPALDLDILNEEAVRACEDLVRERYEDAGYVLVRIGLPPKRAIPFRTEEPFDKIVVSLIAPNGSEGQKIEFLANGQQVVVAGIHPDTKQPYRWHGGEPGEVKREDLPYTREAEAQTLVEDLVELLVRDFGYKRAPGRPGKPGGNGGDRGGGGADDWQYLLDNIHAGRDLHDSLRDLAAKMIAAGTSAGAVVNQLRALMQGSSAPHDERWRERYDDIPRLVKGAEDLPPADPKPKPKPKPKRKQRTTTRSEEAAREELDAVIAQAPDFLPPPPPPQRRASLPVIQCDAGELLAVIEQAERAILAAPEQRLFQRGGMLVRLKRIAQKTTTKGITRDAGSLIIAEATSECVRLEMARCARYTIKRDMRYVATDPPIKYARAIAAKNEFPFKTLLATIETPTLRPDGSVLQERGYDEATGLYFDSAQTFPAINSNPSKDDAARALRAIDTVLKDFPFVDGGGAVAKAAILTALVRRVLPAAPMFLFDAPVQASGKSLLASVVGWIATGREPATQPYTGDNEEDRKRIIATLIAGDSVVSFDNISRPLQDDTLCKVLTQPEVDDRLLGTMTNVKLPTCTTWLGTGVNLVVTGRDMVRRGLKCRIDPGMERPEERKFDYVLRDYVMEHRARLVAAGLTMMRAYIAAGCPQQDMKPYGGFEEWSAMVRAPLVWLGCDDPCASRQEIENADPDTEKLANLLDALPNRFKTEFTTLEVVERAHKDKMDAAAYGIDLTPLHEAVAALCWKGEINSLAVGKAFGKYRDRIVNGRKLIRAGERNKATVWKVATIKKGG